MTSSTAMSEIKPLGAAMISDVVFQGCHLRGSVGP